MAEKKYIKESELTGFGKYEEGPGGGTPVGKGTKYPEGEGRTGYSKAGKPGSREPDQPRTDDGKFTYNAVNGKELKDVSKSHGKSRGVTVPPTLTGGKNGIKYYASKEDGHRDFTKEDEDLIESATKEIVASGQFTFEQVYRAKYKVGYKGKILEAPRDFVESSQEFVANVADKEGYKEAREELHNAKTEEEKIEAIGKVINSGHFVNDQLTTWKKSEPETAEEEQAVAKSKETGKAEFVERKPGEKAEPTVEAEEGEEETSSPVTPEGKPEKTKSDLAIEFFSDPKNEAAREDLIKEMKDEGLYDSLGGDENSKIKKYLTEYVDFDD